TSAPETALPSASVTVPLTVPVGFFSSTAARARPANASSSPMSANGMRYFIPRNMAVDPFWLNPGIPFDGHTPTEAECFNNLAKRLRSGLNLLPEASQVQGDADVSAAIGGVIDLG